MATLGQDIRARRLDLGLTQGQLAQRIGDGELQSDVSRLEHDHIRDAGAPGTQAPTADGPTGGTP